jgi:hypothetical protein
LGTVKETDAPLDEMPVIGDETPKLIWLPVALKFEPETTTEVPAIPEFGLREVMTGAEEVDVTVNVYIFDVRPVTVL